MKFFKEKKSWLIPGVIIAAIVAIIISTSSAGSLKTTVIKQPVSAGMARFAFTDFTSEAFKQLSLQPELMDEVAAGEESLFDGMFLIVLDNEDGHIKVREKASKDSEAIADAYCYQGGKVIKRGEKWTKIKSGEAKGYVPTKCLAFDSEIEEYAGKAKLYYAVVHADEVLVREKANKGSEAVGAAYEGNTFRVTKLNKKGFVGINYDGDECFISAKYVDIKAGLKKITTYREEEEARIAAERAAEEARKAAEAAAAAFEAAIKEAKNNGTVDYIRASDSLGVSSRDAYLLACVVGAEAGYEPYEGQLAVANVVLNRYVSDEYDSIEAVIYAPYQFTVAYNGALYNRVVEGPNEVSLQAARDALAGKGAHSYYSFCSGGAAGSKPEGGKFFGSQYFY